MSVASRRKLTEACITKLDELQSCTTSHILKLEWRMMALW